MFLPWWEPSVTNFQPSFANTTYKNRRFRLDPHQERTYSHPINREIRPTDTPRDRIKKTKYLWYTFCNTESTCFQVPRPAEENIRCVARSITAPNLLIIEDARWKMLCREAECESRSLARSFKAYSVDSSASSMSHGQACKKWGCIHRVFDAGGEFKKGVQDEREGGRSLKIEAWNTLELCTKRSGRGERGRGSLETEVL